MTNKWQDPASYPCLALKLLIFPLDQERLFLLLETCCYINKLGSTFIKLVGWIFKCCHLKLKLLPFLDINAVSLFSSSATSVRRGRQTPSIIFRRPEDAVLFPSPPPLEDTELPSYEQAVALTRKHSISPPPPYPGSTKGFRVFKKSLSLPSH